MSRQSWIYDYASDVWLQPIHRRNRGEVRRRILHWSRQYLGVRRLPSGVPALLDDYINRLTVWPVDMRPFEQMLGRYRRRKWLA